MNPSSRLVSTIAAFSSVLLFSTGGLCIKRLPLTALDVAGFRSLVAALFLGTILFLRQEPFSFRGIHTSGWIASVCYAAMVTAFVFATKLTTAANAIFLQYTMPAWVLLGGAWWLKERITAGRVITIGLCLAGMALFFCGDLRPTDWLGNLVALFSGVTFAALTLLLRKDRDRRPLDSVFLGNVITAVVLTPIAFWVDPDGARLVSSTVGFLLLWLGVFQMGVAYLCFVRALKGLPAIEVAILSLVEPVLNPTWVYLGMGEIPSLWAGIGGGVILLSVILKTLLSGENETYDPCGANCGPTGG